MKTLIMIFILMTASLIGQAQCLPQKMDTVFHLVVPPMPKTIINNYSSLAINKNVNANKNYKIQSEPFIFTKKEIYPINDQKFLSRIKKNYLSNRNFWVRGGATTIGGSLEAHIDATRSFYSSFKKLYPKANDSFWDPKYSSNNKYKNHDPEQGEAFIGSTTIFSGFTDGYHLLKTIRNVCFVGALVIPINSQHDGYHYFVHKKFGDYLFEIISSCIFYEIGMEGTLLIFHSQ